jgi:3,2-trans-enoyl-CoA isomerase
MIDRIDHPGGVREVRLARPPANAISSALLAVLTEAIVAAPGEGVRALVLSGAPGMFSAGLDVPELLTLDRPGLGEAWRGLYALLRALAASPIPIAAAITGHAPAGGTVMTLYCDRRFLADGPFKVGLNEVQVGLPLPPVIFAALRRQVGAAEAERLAVGGLLLPPAAALAARLVDEVLPPEDLVARAVAWCGALAALPHEAMSVTRRMARADLVALFDSTDGELDQVVASWWHPEAQAVLRDLTARLARKQKP